MKKLLIFAWNSMLIIFFITAVALIGANFDTNYVVVEILIMLPWISNDIICAQLIKHRDSHKLYRYYIGYRLITFAPVLLLEISFIWKYFTPRLTTSSISDQPSFMKTRITQFGIYLGIQTLISIVDFVLLKCLF